jgi:hypothetical protein
VYGHFVRRIRGSTAGDQDLVRGIYSKAKRVSPRRRLRLHNDEPTKLGVFNQEF